MKVGAHPRRLVFVMNIPSPYRIDLFNRLQDLARPRGIECEVCFLSETERGRYWKSDPDTWRFEGRVWPGWGPPLGRVEWYVNPSLVARLWRRPPDWLVVGGWIQPTVALLLVGRRLLPRTTTVLSWLEANVHAMRHRTGPIAVIRRAFLSASDGFVVPGRIARATVSDEWGVRGRPFVQLPNLIDTAFYGGEVEMLRSRRHALRAELGIPQERLVLYWSARLEEETKGIQRFLRTSAKVPALRATVLLVGDGPDRQAVESLAASHPTLDVRLLGHVPREHIGKCLAVADVSILPSLRDNNPLTAIESIWAGLPLLTSTQCGNWPETVLEGVNGWVVDPNSEDSVMRGLGQIASASPEKLAAMGAESRALAGRNFDLDAMLTRFLDGLESVKQAPRGPSPF